MNVVETNTVAQTVTENIKAAHIFKKYGIDFCCGGNITIENACKKAKIDQTKLISDLEKIDQTAERINDYKSWSPSFLTDHIINIHHTYV